MARSYLLVKNLGSVDTLKAVNLIAFDKTGTLTENRVMKLSHPIPGVQATVLVVERHTGSCRAMVLCNQA